MTDVLSRIIMWKAGLMLDALAEGTEQGRRDEVERDAIIDGCFIYKFYYYKCEIYIIVQWSSPYTNGTLK